MANNLNAYIREIWAPKVQEKLFKTLVGRQVCDFIPAPDGDTIHKPYHSNLSAGTYTRNATSSAVTPTDITTTDEYLTISTAKYTSFYIDKLDNLQQFYKSLKGDLMDEAAQVLGEQIDTAIFAEYANAGLTVDAGDVGGVDGQAIQLALSGTSGHVLDVIQKVKSKLAGNNVNIPGSTFMVIDAQQYYDWIERYLMSAGFKVQDGALVNGYVGNISGMEIYISNNLAQSTISGSSAKHWIAGRKGVISLAIQAENSLDIIENPMNTDGTHRLGVEYVLSNLFGKKTFYWNVKKLVDIQVKV